MKYDLIVNEYACVVYTNSEGVHMVDGTVLAVLTDAKLLILNVENVSGPPTMTYIPLEQIDDRIA